MPVSNPAAALGEAIGKLIERHITSAVAAAVAPKGYLARPMRLINGANNIYQIDCVVSSSKGSPIIIVDPKYIRYKKHNRDKGSWLCVAHYNLRKAHPTIRKSITILSGRWSAPSIQMIKSFGIEVHELPFNLLASHLSLREIAFEWAEKDRATPRAAWEKFQQLSEEDKQQIAEEIAGNISKVVADSVVQTLDADLSTMEKRVSEVELLLKTTHDEMFLFTYPDVRAAAQALISFLTDRADIGDLLR